MAREILGAALVAATLSYICTRVCVFFGGDVRPMCFGFPKKKKTTKRVPTPQQKQTHPHMQNIAKQQLPPVCKRRSAGLNYPSCCRNCEHSPDIHMRQTFAISKQRDRFQPREPLIGPQLRLGTDGGGAGLVPEQGVLPKVVTSQTAQMGSKLVVL